MPIVCMEGEDPGHSEEVCPYRNEHLRTQCVLAEQYEREHEKVQKPKQELEGQRRCSISDKMTRRKTRERQADGNLPEELAEVLVVVKAEILNAMKDAR
ncbi:hypothetical protein FKM82_021848 [Ascaphus truei]